MKSVTAPGPKPIKEESTQEQARAISRREFARRIGRLGAGALLAGAAPVLLSSCGGGGGQTAFASTPIQRGTLQALKTSAAQKNIEYGAATGARYLQSDPDFTAQFASQCAILTPENELKWENVEPLPGQFNFAAADYMADWASQQAVQVRGHCLVWHEQLPPWAGHAASAADVQAQMISHITNVVQHYSGRAHSWDVVNEALDPSSGRSDYLRNTVWLQALGPSYIESAFRAAAAADPNAVLVYNDYGLECDSSDGDRRRAGALRLLSGLRSSGAPVHALGMQAHLSASGPGFTRLPAFLKQVADLGLKVFITELDVSDQSLAQDTSKRDEIVANVYQDFLQTVLAQPVVSAVVTWGLSDRYTWLDAFEPRSDGQPCRPLPLDSALQPKSALYAMLNAFNAAPAR